MTCTGIAAVWCPVHGDCTCPKTDDGEPVIRYEGGYVSWHGYAVWDDAAISHVVHDPACPLHNETSTHADNELGGS